MSLAQTIALGTVLPHRSRQPLASDEVARVARRAEALGFADLWVTENTLDRMFSFDAFAALTFAAAVTQRIRLGVSVVVLPLHHPIHVAHQTASLDVLSGGRAILGVGLGRDAHYADFGVPLERRVRRFTEGIELMKALWTAPQVDYEGQVFSLHGAGFGIRPVQQPHPPIWLGGGHPDAVRRAALHGDAFMGSGATTSPAFRDSIPILREALERAGRDPTAYPISKRVFMAIDERPERAFAEVQAWYGGNAVLAEHAGVSGTPAQVREKLEQLVSFGANHLLLNSVSNFDEQLEALAEVTGLSPATNG